MSSPLWKRLQLLVSVLTVLAVLAILAAGVFWWRVRGSLPQLDGRAAIPGLAAEVTVERDALGVPSIAGASRADVARALGFLHAQDRFFQMDLSRRSGAGELAELFGPAAVPLDEAHRLHGFRRTAEKVLAAEPPERRALLEAYATGVNAGLAALRTKPWEYLVLRTEPRPWQPIDSVLVIYAMWFDLQNTTAGIELSRQALREGITTGGFEFLAPAGTSWDAAIDDSTFPAPELPAFTLRAAAKPQAAHASPADALLPGSNSFALAGNHTASGAGIVANDMHLNLNVPNAWYRAVLTWPDAGAGGTRRLVGITLPGTPALVAGSNGQVAWGYTNAYVDTLDVVMVEQERTAQAFYRTPQGYAEIEDRKESIAVKGEDPVSFTARWTRWGPVTGQSPDGRLMAQRWNAHDVEATSLAIMELETAPTVEAAVAIAHRAGMPNQNLLVADREGAIGWTVTGKIPRRVGSDGRMPVSWAYGDRRWDGWLDADEIPTRINPADGALWSANQRMVGGDALAKLGDGGYDDGARARQIRDALRDLAAPERKVQPADLLAVALDDRALFLEPWRELLLRTLDDPAASQSSRQELREVVLQWNGRAGTDSAAYRIVRAFRHEAVERTLEPFLARARRANPEFSVMGLHGEDAAWRLASEQPARLLNPQFESWNALLLDAVDAVAAAVDRTGLGPAHFTWGARNRLRMQHPFSRMLPGFLSTLLDMPATELPGDSHMPRVQGPTFGASQRLVVSPGRETEGIFHMPGGQSGHPLSPFYRAGHDAWADGKPTALLPGVAQHTLLLGDPVAKSDSPP